LAARGLGVRTAVLCACRVGGLAAPARLVASPLASLGRPCFPARVVQSGYDPSYYDPRARFVYGAIRYVYN
jgi:hypothetical protein